jgi:hypothetical protein
MQRGKCPARVYLCIVIGEQFEQPTVRTQTATPATPRYANQIYVHVTYESSSFMRVPMQMFAEQYTGGRGWLTLRKHSVRPK